jgi:hypothetical protein
VFDRLELRPCFLCERFRHGLDCTRSRAGVGYAVQLGLFYQEVLDIAGKGAPARGRGPKRGIERQDGEAVRPPNAGRQSGNGGAQQIRMRIRPDHHPPARLGMDAQRSERRPAQLCQPRPEQPQGAQFGNRQKLVPVDCKSCADAGQGVRGSNSALIQGAQKPDGAA